MEIPTWLKILLGVVVLILGLVVADYLAGFFFLAANKTNPFNATLSTFYEYWYHYGDVAAHKKQFQFAVGLSIVITFIAPLIAYTSLTAEKRSLHGDARFATASEVRKSGLMGTTGILVGKFMGKYLMLAGQLFVMLAAPTRSGKGVSTVIPNYLHYSDSIVGLDVKQENFDITSGYRAKYGQAVYLFNPFAEDQRTHRWNPLSYISKNPHFRVNDILAVGFIFYPQEGKDTFWNDQARNLFLGIVLFLCETPELPRTVGEVLRQSSGKGKSPKDYFLDLIAEREESDRPLSESCIDALNRFTSNSDNTLASVISSFNAPLTIWANPIVDAATSGDDFLLTDVRKKRMTIYLGVTPDNLPQASLIINLFYSQLINLNTKELPQKNPLLKYQCLLLKDEATAPGKIEIIAKSVSYMAGYNLRMLVIIQSMSQLASKYGVDDARNLATNHAMQIVFPPREQKDANEYSEMLGYTTEKSVSTSASRPVGFANGGRSNSESVSDQKRALMLPQELKEMSQDKQIILFENTKPILADKIVYYKDPVFVDRLKEISPSLAALGRALPTKEQLEDAAANGELSITVPKLDLDLHMAIIETRIRDLTEADVEAAEAEKGFNLEVLAHDFSDLPQVDNPDNPSAESVSTLVGDFFSRLDSRDTGDNEAESKPDEFDDELMPSFDCGGVISAEHGGYLDALDDFESEQSKSNEIDLSLLDN